MMAFHGTRLSAEGIACVRGGRVLFAGLDLDLSSGGAVLLTGPNGIGKTSLLRILAGLLPPALGTVRLMAPNTHPDGEAMPAWLGHADALKPLLTVAETLDFWTRLTHPGIETARADAIAGAAARFGLGPLGHVPCRYLSAGQRRRTALARIAASGSPLWLLDEPATALDAAGIRALEDALAAHRAAGGMAVIATHGGIAPEGAEILALERFTGGELADPLTRGLELDEDA